MLYKNNISEEEYKQEIANEVFSGLKYVPNYGKSKIDFAIVDSINPKKHLFWAEAKNKPTDIYDMITQLVLTIKKTCEEGDITPPSFIGCFDSEKFAIFKLVDFLPLYNQGVVSWDITPSKHNTPEFQNFKKIISITGEKPITFKIDIKSGETELKNYVKNYFYSKQLTLFDELEGEFEITLSNLQRVFNVWLDDVKPTIQINEEEWGNLRENGVYPSDFFLADLYGNADTGNTEITDMKVIIKNNEYRLGENLEKRTIIPYDFNDNAIAHKNFWKKYKRPPRNNKILDEKITPYEEILERKDLLVPRDIMERKGAFFTPQIWVEEAHKAITEAFGKNWQKEYYVWDCACGTGNLLAGLTNRKNLFASTIDESDIRIIHENMKGLIFKENAFQFDFLNDSFDKLPEKLCKIIQNPEERKKLIVLINPPYSESSSGILKTAGNREGSNDTKVKKKYFKQLGKAANELFIQFLVRIYFELKGCYIAEFSKLKLLLAPSYNVVRESFRAKLISCFLAPAETFDNVSGKFPIGFKIWDTKQEETFNSINSTVYSHKRKFEKNKILKNYDGRILISKWVKKYNCNGDNIGSLVWMSSDFSQQNLVSIENKKMKGHYAKNNISLSNLDKVSIFFSVRWAIEADWLNDRDQFLCSNTEDFANDFTNDCLIYMIFDNQNHVSTNNGENHWIPFSEEQCGSNQEFKHDSVYKYLRERNIPEILTVEAFAVYNAALDIFKYYHGIGGWSFDGRIEYNHNATFYDIRAFFQGRDNYGKVNNTSSDENYQGLIENLRKNLIILRDKNIAPRVYEYGFLLN